MIYIASIFDKNEDFIKLQYESILKHVKGDYEYIVFNNASTLEQSDKIKNICNELNINSIKISVNYSMDPSNIAGAALNEAFNFLSDRYVFKLDSDMFFISNINLFDLCEKNDLFYIENSNKFMWSGVFGINMKKIKDFNLDFRPGVIPSTDTFGQSCLLTSNANYTRKKMQLYCIMTKHDETINGLVNNDCCITINGGILTFNENNLYEHLHDYLPSKYFDISKLMLKYEFPHPYKIDIITIDDIDTILHFKSSNHDDVYHDLQYTKNKKNALIRFLNEN
jgi:hypothetical protein